MGGTGYQVRIPSGDVLVEISGYVGQWFQATYIQQLVFRTRQGRSFGPFGRISPGALPFSFRVVEGEEILAVFGQVVLARRSNAPDTLLVNQLGCYIKHI
jgi:hypothetical protein